MSDTEKSQPKGYSPFIPLGLGLLLVVALVVSQTVSLTNQQDALKAAKANQEDAMAGAQKIQAQLNALAKGTVQLAQQGNRNAQAIQAELTARGVTIKP